MSRTLGATLVVVGIAIAVIGALAWTGLLGWFGKLPGDVRIERGTTRVYVPVVSMLLLSVAISVVSWFVRR